MKRSFWTLGTPGWSDEAVIAAAERFGFHGVDLRCGGNGSISVQSTDDEVKELKQLFAYNGIEIASLLGYTQRGTEDGVDWDAVTDDLVAHMELCHHAGTHNLRAQVGAPAHESSWDAYLEGFAAAVTKALSQVEHIVINFQNHPGSLTANQGAKLAAMVNSDRFGLGLSTDHCVDMGEDPAAIAGEVARWVRYVHLADRENNDGPMTAGKYYASLPGDGVVPNARVLETLQAAGYDGWVAFKWEKPTWPELPDAEIALPRFVSFMKELQPV
jgi:sugar phosphate isomerase/epimerase